MIPCRSLIEEDIASFAMNHEDKEREADNVLRSELQLAESGKLRKSATLPRAASSPSALKRSREALRKSVEGK